MRISSFSPRGGRRASDLLDAVGWAHEGQEEEEQEGGGEGGGHITSNTVNTLASQHFPRPGRSCVAGKDGRERGGRTSRRGQRRGVHTAAAAHNAGQCGRLCFTFSSPRSRLTSQLQQPHVVEHSSVAAVSVSVLSVALPILESENKNCYNRFVRN